MPLQNVGAYLLLCSTADATNLHTRLLTHHLGKWVDMRRGSNNKTIEMAKSKWLRVDWYNNVEMAKNKYLKINAHFC